MVLGFTYMTPGKLYRKMGPRTGFPESVLSSQYGSEDEVPEKYRLDPEDARIAYWKVGKVRPKIHTLRKPSKRKKAGSKLHPTIDARKPETFQFCPVLELISKQKLEIEWTRDANNRPMALVRVDNGLFGWARYSGSLMTFCSPSIKEMALNDGFPNADAFFGWFDEDGEYEILHWTDKEYVGECTDLPPLLDSV